MTEPHEEILKFWFGDSLAEDVPLAPAISKRWFAQDDATDREIEQRFGEDMRRAMAGGLGEWAGFPRGRLALVILLDQFTRNCFRDSPKAFASDGAAQALVREGIVRKQDLELISPERVFFYMPLMHAEDLALQDEGVLRFRALAEGATDAHKERCEGNLDFAVRHRKVIEQFGRFPHRNEVMGRPSTPEELAFLAKGKRF